MRTFIFALFMCFSIGAACSVIIIKGQASPTYGNEPYYLPKNSVINSDTTNLFITVDGVNKVCFLNTTPSPLFEQVSLIIIVINGLKTEWNCFPYTTKVSVVRP